MVCGAITLTDDRSGCAEGLRTDRHYTDSGFLSIAWLLFGVKHFGRLLADPRKLKTGRI